MNQRKDRRIGWQYMIGMLDNLNLPCIQPSTCYSNKRVLRSNRCLIGRSAYIDHFGISRLVHSSYPTSIPAYKFHQHNSFSLGNSDLRYRCWEPGHILLLRFQWTREGKYTSWCDSQFDSLHSIHKDCAPHTGPCTAHWYKPHWICNWCLPSNVLENKWW